MAGLESIVRPFARPDSLATRRIVAKREKVEATPAVITWGKAGTLAAAHQIEAIDESGVNFTVVLCDDKYDELSRKEDPVRITQTLDDGTTNPDNFVDVQRPYEMSFKKVSETDPRRNSSQVWSTAIETANYSTVGFNNKQCKGIFRLNRGLT